MKHHRLKELIEALGSSPSNFEKHYLGETRAKNIYNWLSGDFKMKEDTTKKIIEAVKAKRPDFNEEWFTEGRGEMFGVASVKTTGYDDNTIKELEELRQKNKFLEEQNKILNQYINDLRIMAKVGKFKAVTFQPVFADQKGASEMLTNSVFQNVTGSRFGSQPFAS